MKLNIEGNEIEFELSKSNVDVILGINVKEDDSGDDAMVISIWLSKEELKQLHKITGE